MKELPLSIASSDIYYS